MTLAGLDEVNWKKLETVEGKATRAPAILRDLASGDATKAKKGAQLLIEPLMVESPTAELTDVLVARIKELKDNFASGRKWPSAQNSRTFTQA